MASGNLAEVEEDATYITNKRIQEHFDEQRHEAEKQKRAEEKAKTTQQKKGE